MAKEFDLSQFETIDLAALTVQTPRGEDLLVDGKPVVINLYGPGSKQFVNAKYRLDNAVQARSIAMLRGKGSKNAAEESRQQQAEFYAAVTASVDNFPVSPIDIYLNPKLNYITEQVEKFLSDTENFMPASPTK
jgi:hypothetical protein